MDQFFRTRMGHTLFDSTLPRIATALERIAAALENPGEVGHRQCSQREERGRDDGTPVPAPR